LVIEIARSAYRHGVSEARIRYVLKHCPSPSYLETTRPDRVLFLWHDVSGVPLEVVAIDMGNGDLLVIHAMRLRRIYEAEYLRMLT
jgi:hypothetical protein